MKKRMGKEISAKHGTVLVLGGTGSLLFIFATIIFCFDPLMQYHLPWFDMNMIVCNVWDDTTPGQKTMEIYYDPGIARNAEYDSALVGSSMVQCADAEWFDDAFGCNTEKLTISGMSVKENVLLFNNIFEKKDVKYIFWNYDVANFTEYEELAEGFPMYLWDENPFNDINYLLNKYMMFENLKLMYEYNRYGHWSSHGTNEAYKWDVDSKEFDVNSVLLFDEKQPQESLPKDYYLEICEKNINEFIPFIEEHPNTIFYISLPPYSVLKWYGFKLSGTLDATLAAEEYGVSRLLEFDNVIITSLQTETDIVTDLSYYSDVSHHKTVVNQMIVDAMKNGTNMLTKDNYLIEIRKIKEIVEETDYSTLLEEW